MRSRLAKWSQEGDETRRIFQRRQFNTGSAGRLDCPSEGKLEIILRRHTRIVHCTRRRHTYLFSFGVWAAPPRLTAPLGLVREGFFRFWRHHSAAYSRMVDF